MKTTILSLLAWLALLASPVALLAQSDPDSLPQTTIGWDEVRHDFGSVEEVGGKLEHTFHFTNTGKKPLHLTKVMPACGCTTPEYSKDPIPPGQKGFVKVIFDTKGRMGFQNKTVTVLTNTPNRSTTLTFTVDLYGGPPPGPDDHVHSPGDGHDHAPAEEKNLQPQQVEIAPVLAPGIYFPMPVHDFGTVEEGDTVEHEYVFLNTGTKPITLTNVQASCGCTSPEWPKEPIPRGGKGTIKVKFDTHAKGGSQTKTITVISDSAPKAVTLTLKGEVRIGNKGRIQLDEVLWTMVDRDLKGKRVTKTISFTNKGDAPLNVIGVQTTNPCVSATFTKGPVAPGGKGEVVITRNLKKCHCNENEAVIFNTDGYPADAGVSLQIKP